MCAGLGQVPQSRCLVIYIRPTSAQHSILRRPEAPPVVAASNRITFTTSFHQDVMASGIPPPQTLLYLSSLRQPEASLSFSLADCDRLLRCPVDPNWSDPAEAEED